MVTVTVGRGLIARVSGVHRCGSIWACPLCAPVVRQGRAVDIDRAAATVLAAGGSALFVTATGPHRRGDALAPLFDLTCQFGRLTLTGAKGKGWRDSLDFLGSIRALEVTHGSNGWHPHVHSLLLFDRQLTAAEVARFRSYLWGRWEKALRGRGFPGLHQVHGLDVRPVYDTEGLSQYVAAVESGWGVGLELARSDLKHRGLTPMELLRLWSECGDLESRDLWREYERVTFGRRCIQWSPGLRKRLLPDAPEATDVELAAAEGDEDVLVTFLFGADEWNVWCRAGEVGSVLRQAEELAALFLFLASFGASTKEVVHV